MFNVRPLSRTLYTNPQYHPSKIRVASPVDCEKIRTNPLHYFTPSKGSNRMSINRGFLYLATIVATLCTFSGCKCST